MAITGTGTELDPVVVHSYDELKYACEQHGSTIERYYIKLGADIDCNEYGSDWEWQTIVLGSNSSGANKNNSVDFLDPDGVTQHVIKNVYVKNSNKLFDSDNTSHAEVKSGKIINVFGANPTNFATNVHFDNMSISFQFGTPTANVFSSCDITNCAIYAIVVNATTYHLISYSGAGTTVKNLDLYCEIGGISSSNTCIFHSASSAAYVDSVRVSGKMSAIGSNTPIIASQKMVNSVVNVDMSGVLSEGSAGNKQVISGNGNNTTVVNTSLLQSANPSFYYLPGASNLRATTAQIKTGADLRSLGFLVVNVEE